jgi:hypothetical protein
VVNLKAKTLNQWDQQLFVLARENQYALSPVTPADGIDHGGQLDGFRARANEHHQLLLF